jgi:response regulator RpfG family c-di-GMP phosphodiesterase
MPEMNGAAFLAAVRDAAPDSTRMLLTGQADLGGAAAVVNEGGVFRFLLKPVGPETLIAALQAGVEQYRLVLAERQLLEQTLHGSVKALTEVLSLASPMAFARATRLRQLTGVVFEDRDEPVPWQVDLAVMLSQVGAISLPDSVLERMESGQPLDPTEQAMVDRLPALAEQVLAGIPRLDEVRAAIHWQVCRYSDRASAPGMPARDTLPLGARVLRIVTDYDALVTGGRASQDAIRLMQERPGLYDPSLLDALARGVVSLENSQLRELAIHELLIGMVLAKDVFTRSGVKLIPAGHEITSSLLERVRNFSSMAAGVRQPITVRVPARREPARGRA